MTSSEFVTTPVPGSDEGDVGVVDDASPLVQAAADSATRTSKDATERVGMFMGCGMIREPTMREPP